LAKATDRAAAVTVVPLPPFTDQQAMSTVFLQQGATEQA
jgi:hypothetical protein